MGVINGAPIPAIVLDAPVEVPGVGEGAGPPAVGVIPGVGVGGGVVGVGVTGVCVGLGDGLADGVGVVITVAVGVMGTGV